MLKQSGIGKLIRREENYEAIELANSDTSSHQGESGEADERPSYVIQELAPKVLSGKKDMKPSRPESEIVDANRIKIPSAVTPYLLLIALSVHGIFEGLSIGVQQHYTSAINLTVAVLFHKWTTALSLGINFAKGKIERKHAVAMIVIFGTASPLGIGIGWIFANASDLLSASFMAIAAGTFIYISASEIVVEEFSVSKHKWLKFVFFLLGVALICILWFTEHQK